MKKAKLAPLLACTAILAICSVTAWAEPKTDKVLWDYWYTVSVGKAPYEYYNDRVETKKDRITCSNRAWKKEEDFINEEQLGAFAQNDDALTPLFFNFHSTYRSTETMIDGNVKDKLLTVKVRKTGTDLPLIKRGIPKNMLLSSLVPVWLGRHMKELESGKTLNFYTILEDNLEAEFSTVTGTVQGQKPDDFAIKTKTQKVLIHLSNVKSIWWIEASGVPIRIEIPENDTIVDHVTADQAKKFLQ